MLSFVFLGMTIFSLGCSPTCEQTCKKLLSCDAIVTSEMECENACVAQEQLFDDWADSEEAEQDRKEEEDQNRNDAENSNQTYSPTTTVSQTTQQSEDEEPSSKYQEAFDTYKKLVQTCS